MEKAHIILAINTMHRGGSAGEPIPGDVTTLLRAWSEGNQHALAQLRPIVYEQLRRLAPGCITS
jgi:hypothetical protein